MKKLLMLAVIALVSLVLVDVRADGGTGPHITIGSSVANKYLGFGTGSVLSNDPAVQSDVFVLFDSGFYLDLWNSKSLKGSWDDGSFGNEVEYALGWKGSVGNGLRLNISATYFDEPKAFDFGAGDIVYVHTILMKDLKLLTVELGHEGYIPMPGSGFQGGNLFSLGASKSWSLYQERLTLRTSVAGVYDTGTIGTDHGFIARGTVGLDWKASKRLTFNLLKVNWFVPLTVHDKRTSDAMVSMGVSFNIR